MLLVYKYFLSQNGPLRTGNSIQARFPTWATSMATGCQGATTSGMAHHGTVGRKQPQSLFLGLRQEEFVKRILVAQRLLQLARCMLWRQIENGNTQSVEHSDDLHGLVRTLASSARVTSAVLQAHFPNETALAHICTSVRIR